MIGASKLFSEAAKKATRDLVKHAATFHAGACLSRAATKDSTQANSAIAALEAYLSAEANGYFVPEAKVRLAQARLANNDSAGAEAMIAPLEGEATTAGWALRWNALLKATRPLRSSRRASSPTRAPATRASRCRSTRRSARSRCTPPS
ncbi:MAG: hypothetical protein H6837_13310 [Planctomycetes bacterium]|nr:hypothetical protein [Planctomycetota bacterium]